MLPFPINVVIDFISFWFSLSKSVNWNATFIS